MVRKVGPCSKVSFKSPLGRALGLRAQLERTQSSPWNYRRPPALPPREAGMRRISFQQGHGRLSGELPDRPFFSGRINWFCLSDWESSSH